MKKTSCISIALVAGLATGTAAFAQKAQRSVHPRAGLHAVAEVAQRGIDPDIIRTVNILPNGQVQPTSDWQAYRGGSGGVTDTAFQYVFDSVRDNPGEIVGSLPTGGRYTFYLVTNGDNYTTAIRNFDMAGIPAAAQGQGAKVCEFLLRENVGGPLFVTIGTYSAFNMANAPTTWTAASPAIQLGYAAGVGVGFWFFSIDVTTQAPPVSNGWTMPASGAGAYQFTYARDATNTTVATSVQPGCWGTGATAQPPVARVGTAGVVGQDDEGNPAAACNVNTLAVNNPDFIVQTAANCEVFAWGPFGVPAPATTTLAPAIGFAMKLAPPVTGACCTSGNCTVVTQVACTGTWAGANTTCITNPCPVACYPNCNHSTDVPCLNIQDFGCFLNAFANGDTYANCNNSTDAPVLNIQDFGCFLNAFANGCSSC